MATVRELLEQDPYTPLFQPYPTKAPTFTPQKAIFYIGKTTGEGETTNLAERNYVLIDYSKPDQDRPIEYLRGDEICRYVVSDGWKHYRWDGEFPKEEKISTKLISRTTKIIGEVFEQKIE